MNNTLTLKSRYEETADFEALPNILFIYTFDKHRHHTTIELTYAQAKELKLFLERNFS